MAETVTTGIWTVDERNADAFVEAWTEFAAWASAHDGAGALRLGRDPGHAGRYVSFAPWTSIEAVHAWKADPEFRQRMAKLQELVEDFQPAELEVVAGAAAGEVAGSAVHR